MMVRTIAAFGVAVALVSANHARVAFAEAPVPIESVSAEARVSLSDATLVTVDGRPVSLGVLRREHLARMERLRSGASLGAAAASKLRAVPRVLGKLVRIVPPLRLRTGASAPTPAPPTPQPYSGGGSTFDNWATDYESFCNAANATLCTYLPASSTLTVIDQYPDGTPAHFVRDKDPLITDPTICKQGGGTHTIGGCEYYYPSERHVEFDPATLVDYAGSCSDGTFTSVNDPHGAAEIKLTSPPSKGSTMTTGAAAVTCLVTITTSKGK